MFLSSGNDMKLSSGNNYVTKQDFISNLPDTLLTHILSLLPDDADADACRTSVLSKRWKDLWMFIPNVHFTIPDSSTLKQASEYYDLAEKILAIRDGLPIRRFFLSGSEAHHDLYISNWLHIAIQHKVQILVLRFPPDGSWVSFCLDMFTTCETLVELALEGQFCLEVPKDKVFFPCLKKISLVSIFYGGGDKSFANLITSCCPVLEELFLERQELDYLETIKISSISLKRLRIYNTVDVGNECVIDDAPKLEYLYIEDKMEYGCDYSFTKKPPSLVEAYIDTKSDTLFLIFPNISAVKVLTLTSPTIRAFNKANENFEVDEDYGRGVPTFPNLVKLVIDLHDIPKWRLLHVFLEKMPNLEHITFLNGLLSSRNGHERDWNPPMEAPACLRFKLKEIIILNQEAITQEELILIWYMLNHSDNLEVLTVNGHEDPMRLEVLLKFHRGSNVCRFEII